MSYNSSLFRWILPLLALVIVLAPAAAQEESAYRLPLLPVAEAVADAFEGETTARLYGFHASAGDVITIAMTQTSGSSLDPLLILMDAEGALLAVDDDSGTQQLAALIEDVEIEQDGSYLLLATSLDFMEGGEIRAGDTLEYTLMMSGAQIPLTVTEQETVVIEADALSAAVADEVTEDQPLRFFLLEAAAGDQVSLEISSDEFFTLLMIFAPEGDRLGADPSALEGQPLEDEGVYLVVVTDAFFYLIGEDGDYFTGGAFDLSAQ